jgi:hypothetical protein
MDKELEFFMDQFGLVELKEYQVEPEFDEPNEYQICMAKDYFRSPYDEQGEIMF